MIMFLDCSIKLNFSFSNSVDTRFVAVTLPKEGIEPWEINEKLAKAIKAGKLTLHYNQFILVCAKHLLQTHQAHRFKNQYRNYADVIVTKYPCLKDVGRNCSYISCSSFFYYSASRINKINCLYPCRKL
jgi:hypothetical protein